MEGRHGKPIEAHILALPETAGSALYGMVDVLAATGTLWRELSGEEPGHRLITPRIVSTTLKTFRCGNGIPVSPEVTFQDAPAPDLLVLPELWLAPTDDMQHRYDDLKQWIRDMLQPRDDHLHSLLRVDPSRGHRVARREKGYLPLGISGLVQPQLSRGPL